MTDETDDLEDDRPDHTEVEPRLTRVDAQAERAAREPPKRRSRGVPPVTQQISAVERAYKERREKDAHFVWGEVLAELEAKGRHPSEVTIYITRLEPPEPMTLGSFPGNAVSGGPDVFYNYVVDYYHARRNSAALYECRFHWRGNSQLIRIGTLRLPSPEEIARMGQPREHGLAGTMNAPAYQAPPQQPHYAGYGTQSSPPAPPPPMAPPPASVPQGSDPHLFNQIANLRAEVLRDVPTMVAHAVAQTLQAMGLGQLAQPAPVAAAPPPPPPTPPSQDQALDSAIELALRRAGIPVHRVGFGAQSIGAAPLPYGAPPPAPVSPPPPTSIVAGSALAELRALVQSISGLRGVARDIEAAFSAEPPEVDAIPIEPSKPADSLPFDVIPIPGGTFSDGQIAHYARSKETGRLDFEGIIASNPIIAERFAEVLGRVVEQAASAIPGAASMFGGAPPPAAAEQKTQVVNETPAGARDATDHQAKTNGAGWPSI
jgi:hypothetical protein